MLLAHCTSYLNKENSHNVKVFSGLVITLHTKQKIKCSHMLKSCRISPGWNFAPVFKTKVKSPRGKLLPRVERVTTYRSFFIDRGNFSLGPISPRGEFSCVTSHLVVTWNVIFYITFKSAITFFLIRNRVLIKIRKL